MLRKAGWDTHGLPVELEVEKQLNIRGKEEIEAYGVENLFANARKACFHTSASGANLRKLWLLGGHG